MTPQLRFPAFTDEWQVRKLADLSKRISDGIHSTPKYEEGGKYYFINGNNFVNNKIMIFKSTKKVSSIEFDKYKIAMGPHTILMSINGTIGSLARYSNEPVMLGKSACYINLKKNVATDFIYNKIQTQIIKNYFEGQLNGSTIKNLSLKTIKDTSIPIPTIAEQEKIAEFLTALDERVALQDKKVELLQKYKKSVMQKIFSQKIRFKDESGNNYPDWKEKKLNEIGAVIGGGTPDTSNLAYWGGVVRWLTPTEVKSRFITKSKKSITEAGLKHSSAKMLPVGAIIFTSRATVGDIAISKVPLATNQGFQSIVVLDDNDSRYIYYWMIVNKNVFLRKASGSTFTEISSSEMKKINIQLPCIEEQKKIYSLLTLCDDKIDIEKTKLIEAKKFKKALLQRMFV